MRAHQYSVKIWDPVPPCQGVRETVLMAYSAEDAYFQMGLKIKQLNSQDAYVMSVEPFPPNG